MFSPFPGFEDVEIRVEAECNGRKRPVVVRIESLPSSPSRATPVCSFADAPGDGEWLLLNGPRDVFTFGNPFNLLRLRRGLRGDERKREEWVEFVSSRVGKLQNQIERAFGNERNGLHAVRAVELPQLPREPRFALLSSSQGTWRSSWTPVDGEISVFSLSGFDFFTDGPGAKQWLLSRWNDSNSPVRFAWEWATWNDEERVARSSGLTNGASEIEQVMKWVLLSSPVEGQTAWRLNPQQENFGAVWHSDDEGNVKTLDDLARWQQWLRAHFFAGWRADWVEQHACVRSFWEWRALAEAYIEQPPTMHERLEARLQLRQWLQGKATPDEIEQLLAT